MKKENLICWLLLESDLTANKNLFYVIISFEYFRKKKKKSKTGDKMSTVEEDNENEDTGITIKV